MGWPRRTHGGRINVSASLYPLTVALPGGRVNHSARVIGTGYTVITLCGESGEPTGNKSCLPYCTACAERQNSSAGKK